MVEGEHILSKPPQLNPEQARKELADSMNAAIKTVLWAVGDFFDKDERAAIESDLANVIGEIQPDKIDLSVRDFCSAGGQMFAAMYEHSYGTKKQISKILMDAFRDSSARNNELRKSGRPQRYASVIEELSGRIKAGYAANDNKERKL